MCVKRSYAIVRARQANVKVRGTTKIDVDEWLYGQGGEKSELRRNRNSTGTKVSVHLCVSQKKIDGGEGNVLADYYCVGRSSASRAGLCGCAPWARA